MPKTPNKIYQIKVTLKNIKPPVWRRILVPHNTTLLKLHDILQIVMGWKDYHLHEFTIEGSAFGDPENDEYGDRDILNEADYKLNQVIFREGQRFDYEYDFGDGWSHDLLVEKILPRQKGVRYPVCVTGKRACPPEDVGGPWGYEDFLRAIRDPFHSEHEEYLTWIGGEFDPEAFDLEEINAQLRTMGRGRSTEAMSTWYTTGDEIPTSLFDRACSWSKMLPEEEQLETEELPLRLDVITLLNYLRDNKVTGTQSLGNLPLKAVYEICAQFVDPPFLEETVGDRVFRVRSETEVWPLFFRHILTSIGGLAKGGLGKRWKVTPLGERFLAASPVVQVRFLLEIWWTQINWGIATPYYLGDGYMPPRFAPVTLTHLLKLPQGQPTSFERFVDQILDDSRIIWSTKREDYARRIWKTTIERTVVIPLVDFGILQTDDEPYKMLGLELHHISTFQVTSSGRKLLEAIYAATNPGP